MRDLVKMTDEKLKNENYLQYQIDFIRRYENIMYKQFNFSPALDQLQFLNKHFLNYCQCTNWTGLSNKFVAEKTKIINQFLEDILNLDF